MSLLRAFTSQAMKVKVYNSRQHMGAAAAEEIVSSIKELISANGHVRMIFAAAPSQSEVLDALSKAEGIDWSKVTAFHMDEYIGLSEHAPQLFSRFLKEHLFDKVKPGKVHYLDGNVNLEAESQRYSALLEEQAIDIVCMGIGENGHIAFNDPPVADFADPLLIKSVELDDACRQQQVNDGCFNTFNDVPTHAMTLTIPTLFAGSRLFCMVPGPTKHNAVKDTLHGPISTDCPASILRTHPSCTLFLDVDSYGSLT